MIYAFELGGGSGVLFLFSFFKLKHRVSGINYSEKPISIANRLRNDEIKGCELDNLNTKIKLIFVDSNQIFPLFRKQNFRWIF